MEKIIDVYYDVDVENAGCGIIGILTTTEKDYFDKEGCMSDGSGTNYDLIEENLESISCECACDSTYDMYIDEATMLIKMKELGFNMIKSEKFTSFLNKH